jgi:hypothetical protein
MNLQRQPPKKPPAATRGRLAARLRHTLPVVWLVFFLWNVVAPGNAAGQEVAVDEYKLKAAMLYHLTQFVEWPEEVFTDRRAPILLCILGQDLLANSLASTIPKEPGSGRTVLVRHLHTEREIPGCHILYISSSERKAAAHIVATMIGSGVLTVGEMSQFAVHGGMIQFSVEDQHVRFDINLDAASRAGLKISSKLLALAQIVKHE